VDRKQSLHQHYTGEVNLHLYLIGFFMLHVCNHIFITHATYICRMICCSFDSNLRRCYSYEKNIIVDFTVDVHENSDPGHPDNCMLVTNNNNDGCEVEHIAKRCRLNNDFDQSLKQNYATLIGVISLMCPDV
jgi:hypothetical protein